MKPIIVRDPLLQRALLHASSGPGNYYDYLGELVKAGHLEAREEPHAVVLTAPEKPLEFAAGVEIEDEFES